MKFITPKQNEIIVFTDGSSRGNPGKGGYGCQSYNPIMESTAKFFKSAILQRKYTSGILSTVC
jgi:ribonuclease HI